MTAGSVSALEHLLRDNGLGWMIEKYAPRDRAIPRLLEQLDRVAAAYHDRIGVDVQFTPEALAAEADRNPHKVRAFLQALGTTRSAEMLVMVWRILQGLSIRKVSMDYGEQEYFNVVVILARPGDGQDALEEYRSSDINDAGLLRHFGITTVNGRPLFDGFFPMRHK
jgi:hypothetical protein